MKSANFFKYFDESCNSNKVPVEYPRKPLIHKKTFHNNKQFTEKQLTVPENTTKNLKGNKENTYLIKTNVKNKF